MNIWHLPVLIVIALNSVTPFNILAIYPYNGKSHFLVFRVFLRELSKRGHNVTVISHFPEKDPPENYYDISLAGTIKAMEDSAIPIRNKYWGPIMDGLYLLNTGTESCEVMLANQQVQELIKQKPNFDVTVMEQFNSDCALGIAHKLGTPVVATTSNVILPFHFERFGIPRNPSFVPFHFFGGGTHPNLKQRLERMVFDVYFKTIHYLTSRHNENTLAKYFDDVPPLEDLAREIKFILVYQNFILTGSQLLPPNVIEVGGYHVEKAKPLVGDLKKFVDETEHGIIYVSFGSIIKGASLPDEKRKAILEAMNEFPQRFIWKWEDKNLEADKNKVYFDSWLPQIDILGHPKTLAFFSHAGMGGTTEALYFGVPIVAMPIDGDQPCNAASIEESGLGVQLHFEHLTKDKLVAALKTVLDPKFQTKAKELSSAWHDRPRSALDTAVFWTEYTARHPLLTYRTRAADIPFYQYLFLDIIALFMLVTFVFYRILILCCKLTNKRAQIQTKRSQKTKTSKRD